MNRKSKSKRTRRFVHVKGFLDGTEAVEVEPNGDTYIVRSDGLPRKKATYCNLLECLELVKCGKWREVCPNSRDRR